MIPPTHPSLLSSLAPQPHAAGDGEVRLARLSL